MTETLKEFFTLDEWDLIHSLVAKNSEFCEDDEDDPLETYTSIIQFFKNWRTLSESR